MPTLNHALNGQTDLTHLGFTEYQPCVGHYCIFEGHSRDKIDQIPTLTSQKENKQVHYVK